MVLLEGSPGDVLEELSEWLAGDERAGEALANLRDVTHYLRELGVAEGSYSIAPRLARGLSYYTGVVFEAVLESPPMGSLLGGGRYDELIGAFAGRSLATVGASFGIERLHDVMTELGMGPGTRTVSDVFVTLFDAEHAADSLRLARELRLAGFNVETALDPTEKLGKQLKYADRRGFPFALVVGPDEHARGEVVVRDLRSGEQHSVARAAVASVIRGEQSK
jgi:histidyl-tRNA synthetase